MFAESSSSCTNSSEDSDDEKTLNVKKKQVRTKKNSFLDNFRTIFSQETTSTTTTKKKNQSKIETSDLFMIDLTHDNRDMAVKSSLKGKKDQIDAVEFSSSLNAGEADLMEFTTSGLNEKSSYNSNNNSKVPNARLDELMKKSVITPEFLKKEAVPPYIESIRAQKKRRKEEKEKTKGKGWFDMPATEMTDERKRDLEIMQLRDSLDPKQIYRRDERKVLPKYFQIGTIIEDPSDFYSARIPKKQRKQTIVDELLADAEFRKQNKKKYQEIVAEKRTHQRRKIFKKPHKIKFSD